MMNTVNKIIVAIVACAACILLCNAVIGSPAATQAWVEEYVRTNSVQTVTVTNAVKAATIVSAGSTATVMEILNNGGANSVSNAMNQAINEASAVMGPILEGGF